MSRRSLRPSRPAHRSPSRRSRATALVCAVAGFVVTTAVLGRLLPPPDLGDVSDKLEWFEKHRDEYDVLFFGSSRIHQGVVASLFDRELRRLGRPIRSFNFGVAGMGSHETSALVRRVLRMEPRRLRWVVVELDRWSAAPRPENRFKRRIIAWHDPAETAAALRTVLLTRERPLDRIELSWSHLLHLGARSTGAGRGRDWLVALRRPESSKRPAPDYSDGQGFAPFSESAYGTPSTHPFRRRFLRMIPAYRSAVARLAAANRAEVSLATYNVQAVEEQVGMIRRAAAEPVYLITPTARPTPELYRLAADGEAPRMLAFNDPERYPELFAVENRFDAEHLTTAGAERFTRLLAKRFARIMEDGVEGERPASALRIAERN